MGTSAFRPGGGGASLARRGLFCAAVLAAVVAPGAPRAATGGIQVRVFDPGGKKPVAGVEVTLGSEEQLVARTTVATDAQGVAYFPVLRVGSSYAVAIVHPGYARQEVTGVRVRAGEVTRIPVRLAPSFSEKVVLSSRRDTVDLERPETATRFGGDFIEDLPVMGRFYQDVLRLAAGVQDADGDGNPNVHGARASDFRAQVGGISNQDPLTGEWLSFVNPDSIEEIEVLTAGAGVEYSRAQGGFASIVQKQGSNDLEGRVGFLWRSSRLDPASATDTAGFPRMDYEWWQPSVQISGPISKDRLWYRLSHEWIRVEEPFSAQGVSELSTRDQTVAADQLTWQASPRNKLAFQFSYDPMVLGNLGVNALTPSSASVRKETGGPTYTLTWTAPASSSVLVDSLVSWQEGHQRILPNREGVPNDCASGLLDSVTGEYAYGSIAHGQCQDLGSGRTSGSYPIRQRDDRQRLTVKSQATLFVPRFLGASHQLRLGLVSENERYFRSLTRLPESMFSIRRVPRTDAMGRTHPVEIGRWDVTIAMPETTRARVQGANVGLYVEDMAKPLPNLTLTLGARLDHEEIRSVGFRPFDPASESAAFDELLPDPGTPYQRMITAGEVFTAYEGIENFAWELGQALDLRPEDFFSILSAVTVQSGSWAHKRRAADIDLTNTNFAPRMSVAWDPRGDGKTKISATAGRYYGAIFLGVAAVEVGPATTTLTLLGERTPGTDLWGKIGFSAGLNPAVSFQMVDRGLRTPHQDELTLALEREILPETSLRLTYVRRRFRDQIQTTDINHYSFDYGTCVVQRSPDDPWIDFSRKDGILDDCDGTVTTLLAGTLPIHEPDGYADTYVYNPAWGSIYLVGNYNSAEYDGWVVDLTRRQYRNWQMQASYTFSKAIGDAEDWLSPLGDDRSILDAERGYLSYDQHHVVKANATTITPWGFRLGATASWGSGLPYSILAVQTAYDSVSPQFPILAATGERQRIRYPTGQRNDRRNRATLQIALKADREWSLPGGMSLQTSLEVFNLLNDRYYQIYNRDLKMGRQINGRNEAYVLTGRQYQIGMKLTF